MKHRFFLVMSMIILATRLYASQQDKLLKAINQLDLDEVKAALEAGADANIPNKHGVTPIMEAAFVSPSGHWNWTAADRAKYMKVRISILKLLILKGADLHHKDKFSRTILNFALFTNDSPYELIEFLVNAGARADTIDSRGDSPVDMCISQGFPRELELLLQKGGKTNNPLALFAARGEIDKLKASGVSRTEINKEFGLIRGTLLTIAIRFDRFDMAKYLISQGADLDIASEFGPLFEACIKAKPAMLELLIRSGANIEITDYLNNRPLHMAASWCGAACVRLLLEKGAMADPIGHVGYTPLAEAVKRDDFESAKLLVKYGANVNTKISSGPIVFEAIDHSKFDIVDLFIQNGLRIDTEGQFSRTLVTAIGQKGRFDLIEKLRLKGLDLQKVSTHGWTYLMEFSQSGNIAGVKYLLQYKPNISFENKNSETALTLSIKAKNIPISKLLIQQSNPIKTYKDRGCSALVSSVAENMTEIAEILLKQGVDPNKKCHNGFNAFHVAAIRGSVQLLNLLSKFGANIDTPANGTYNTALHLAIYEERSKAAQYLITSGINLRAKNKAGKSALILAEENQMTEIIILLKEHLKTR